MRSRFHHAILRSRGLLLRHVHPQQKHLHSSSFQLQQRPIAICSLSNCIDSHRQYSKTTPVLEKDNEDTTSSSLDSTSSYPNHTLNVAFGLIKSYEASSFKDLVDAPVVALQGIGPQSSDALTALGLKSISDMSKYKYYHIATTISVLASIEEVETVAVEDEQGESAAVKATNGRNATATKIISTGRLDDSAMNMNKAIDKGHEHLTFHEILKLPVYVIQGISEKNETKLDAFKVLGIKTIEDLAKSKYFHWSNAIVTAAKYEE